MVLEFFVLICGLIFSKGLLFCEGFIGLIEHPNSEKNHSLSLIDAHCSIQKKTAIFNQVKNEPKVCILVIGQVFVEI